MAKAKTVWAIDIGQCALKALKLRNLDGELQVDAFETIEHAQILSQPDADRRQLIRTALETFLSRQSLSGSTVAIAVPGQTSLSRFVKLPPVETKKIPDIVRFEAEQQIPFPIDEVIWRWQTFPDPDSPDIEVGIFAMKQVDIAEMLERFTDVSVNVDLVQMAPLSLYNFMRYDGHLAEGGATLLADIGANKTDLVVADGPRAWNRTIQIGGNNFTDALARAFKLSFSKAETLKRTAASSKYARQVFQAMRPVFADLVQEIQRSIGYYTSLHREARFKKLIGLGNGFRLPGLQKFLEQNLNVPVARIDSFNRLTFAADVKVPLFTENILTLAVVYGTALQALAPAAIDTNLLPADILRRRLWASKRPWFAAAAACVLLALAAPLYRGYADRSALAGGGQMARVNNIIADLQKLQRDYNSYLSQGQREEQLVQSYMGLFAYRTFWPAMERMISESVKAVASDQQAFSALARDLEQRIQIQAQLTNPKTDEKTRQALTQALAEVDGRIAAIRGKPRQSRRIIVIDKVEVIKYFANAENKSAESILAGAIPADDKPDAAGQGKPGFAVVLQASTPLPENDANQMLTDLKKQVDAQAGQLKSVRIVSKANAFVARAAAKPGAAPAAAPGEQAAAVAATMDPLFPGEDPGKDTQFRVCWVVAVESTGLPDIVAGKENP